MHIARRFTALGLLVGWLFAAGHVALEHGATGDGGVLHGQFEHDHQHQHHDDPLEHDGHHDHDLTSLAAGQLAKTANQKSLASVWVPLYSALVERLAAMSRAASESCRTFDFGDSPPDERASGWLFVVQTALPVRGPSLAA